MRRVVVPAVIGTLVGLGLGWGLFGVPWTQGDATCQESPAQAGSELVGGERARESGGSPSPGEDGAPIARRRVAPRSPACPACPACPSEADVASRDRTIASLLGRLQRASELSAEAEAKAEAAEAATRGPRYDAPTAAGRRVQAAQKGNLLVEFPDWNDRLTLRDGVADETGLDAGHQQALEELYATTNARLRESLQKLYAELVGDPQAGNTSTLNALLHDVMSLSPQEACNQKLPALLQALADERPLPPTGPDPLPCEAALRLVFQTVDALDEQARSVAGEAAHKALWSGSSSFEFGARKPR